MKIHTTALLATIGSSAWTTTDGFAFSPNTKSTQQQQRLLGASTYDETAHQQARSSSSSSLHSTKKDLNQKQAQQNANSHWQHNRSGAMEAELRAKAAERRVAILQNQLNNAVQMNATASSDDNDTTSSSSSNTASSSNDDSSSASNTNNAESNASTNESDDDVNGVADEAVTELRNRLLDMEDKLEFEQMNHDKEQKKLREELEAVQSALETKAKVAAEELDKLRSQMAQAMTDAKDEAADKQRLMEEEYQEQLHQKEDSILFLQEELKEVSKKFADEMRGRERDASDANEKASKLREDLTRQIIDVQKESAERILALEAKNKKLVEAKDQNISDLEEDVFDREQQIFQLESERSSFRSIAKMTLKLTGKRIRNVFRRNGEPTDDGTSS